MSDMIDRKMAIDAVCRVCQVCDYNKCKGRNHFSKWCEEITALREIPPAEPKKGHWIGISDGYADGYPVYVEWECSCCGVIEEDEKPTWNYCPNCGAKMEDDE